MDSLARFDGFKFKIFDADNTPELRNKLISRIFEDSRGRLWLGCEAGEIMVYSDGDFCRLTLPREWPARTVDNFAEDVSGHVWIVNREGWLMTMDDLKAGTISKPGELGRPLIRDEEGHIWIRKVLPGGECLFQTIGGFKLEATPPVTGSAQAFPSRTGGLWVSEEARLRRWHAGRWRDEQAPFPSLGSPKPPLVETRNGRLVAGSFQDGLFIRERDKSLTHLTTATGLTHNRVYCLREDSEGSLWVGTGGGGLNMLRTRRVNMLNSPDDWLGLSLLAVAPAEEGGLWITTEGAGIYRWTGAEVRPSPHNDSLPTKVITSLLPIQHSLWLGSWGYGLSLLSNNLPALAPESARTPRDVVCLYADRKGRIWVGTTVGLGCLDGGKYLEYDAGPPQPKPVVRCITETADGSIWFGTMGSGLCCLRNGYVTRLGTADGLASDYVSDLWAAPGGALWAATFGSGISRFKDGRLATVSKQHGLPSNDIGSIQEDDSGGVWMSSSAGIIQITARALNECADGARTDMNSLVYGRSVGLSSLDFVRGQNGRCRMKDGRLCFATRTGVAIVDPAQATPSEGPPPVRIEEFLVDGKPVPLPGNRAGAPTSPSTSRRLGVRKVPLQPGERWVEVRYTAISFASPQQVQFRYRLDGLDKQWIYAGTRRSVDYRRLPPGEYVFRVIACNPEGTWSSEGASLAFSVLPHFWQTWWFLASGWLGGTGAVAGGVLAVAHRRRRRMLELLERQTTMERERTRIARDIHDELGSCLTRITMFSQSAQAKLKAGLAPEYEMKTIFTTARDVTRSVDEIVWAINPEHDTLRSLMAYVANFVEEFLNLTGVSFELNFPLLVLDRPITAAVRHEVFLAFKEALNNAVKHAAASKIVVSLEEREDQFILSLDDDGRGFDQHAQEGPSVQRGRRFPRNGLENMRKRLHAIGGSCQIESTPDRGTRIHFSIPWQK